MTNELFLTFGALIAATLWLAIKYAMTVAQAQRQLDIMRRGALCQGRIVAVQRPFMLDACTRLYFDFVPEGAHEPLRACHVERRPHDELRASLPAAGATVAVHYLRNRPDRAVISNLVPC